MNHHLGSAGSVPSQTHSHAARRLQPWSASSLLVWLGPSAVRFDDSRIPAGDIDAGRALTSIQRADRLGDHYDQVTQRWVAHGMRIGPAMACFAGWPRLRCN